MRNSLMFSLTVAAFFASMAVGSVSAEAASAGGAAAATFSTNCATCHAANGSGDTAVGKSVHIPDLRSPAVQSQSDAQLTEVIANGKNAMPPFKGNLSEGEIGALAQYVRGLAKTK